MRFSKDAIETASKANLKVDDYQGYSPAESHLHAMLGGKFGGLLRIDHAGIMNPIGQQDGDLGFRWGS